MLTRLDIMRNAEYLKECVVNENISTPAEYDLLNEEQKEIVVSEIMKTVLTNITAKIKELDTTKIDKSRGEIKNLDSLSDIQNAIKELTSMYENANSDVSITSVRDTLNIIITAIMNLSKNSSVFKDAYRTKKSVLIVTYQSIVMAIISALSYLISESVDFNMLPNVSLKNKIQITEINQIKTLKTFNKLCKNGDFTMIHESVDFMREYYNEYDVKQMNIIYEASDIGDLINNGFNNIINKLTSNNQLNSLLLKVSSILALLLAARETIYSVINSKSDIAKSISNIISFTNHRELKPTQQAQVKQYNKKNVIDTVVGSNSTNNMLNIENNVTVSNISKADSTTNLQLKDLHVDRFDLDTFNF